MINFAKIEPDKENDKVELIRVAALNGGLLALMKMVEVKAKELAEAMSLVYEGTWNFQIDYQRMTVLVWKDHDA